MPGTSLRVKLEKCCTGNPANERRRLKLRFGSAFSLSLVVGTVLAALANPPARGAEPSATEAEFFEKDVRPLLIEKCWSCHGDQGEPKGGLRLTSRPNVMNGGDSGPVAVAGDPKGSPLIEAVRYEHEPKMPPKGKLKDREIEVLSRWVSMGLPWPESKEVASTSSGGDSKNPISLTQRQFWAFQPVKDVAVPAVRDGAWCRSPVDRFLLADLERAGLTPTAPAEKRTLLRRATFDLTGLPPTTEEIRAFLADDSPEAFARVVDRLLASPRYGERWGRHWLDVVRYADARDLIQLPAESDFREAWRYRDWVVDAFNRDLPYAEFIRGQVAGDLLPAAHPGEINQGGLIATGMLAIADFVPGDVDKEQMIADYVNDQIDVVSKAFLGLSVACARCHDHKFDPISTEDYYALAGIFFSTRLIPGPVAGNTPLVRVPLLTQEELAAIKVREGDEKKRRMDLERRLPDEADHAYVALLQERLAEKGALYLTTAAEFRQQAAMQRTHSLTDLAREKDLELGWLSGLVAYLDKVAAQTTIDRHTTLREAALGTLTGAKLADAALSLQRGLAALIARKEQEAAASPATRDLARASLIRLRADDPYLITDADGRALIWPNRAGLSADAKSANLAPGPMKTPVETNEKKRTVLRFDGQALLEVPRRATANGTLFVVFRPADVPNPGQRLLGWEDADSGRHGLGLMLDPGGRLHAILRNNGRSGDLVDARMSSGLEIVCLTWGPQGTALYRNGVSAGTQKGIEAISSDPMIATLRLGGPGSGGSPRFRGDLAEVRVYDRPLEQAERQGVENELRAAWIDPMAPRAPASDALAELYEEWFSARGPFWLTSEERRAMLSLDERLRLDRLGQELEDLKKKLPQEIPQAVVVQDGGPKGTRHEGFKDAQVFLRGNPKRTGKTVPRGVPRVLQAEQEPALRISSGSGRLELAGWIARPDNPLTARVMVNRIWQHHFGEGLVRTPNDFGERGERPTNPGLLDWLAGRFVESGWSTKAIHRLIMLSSAYQQGSQAVSEAVTKDPDNRLVGRMNRRRLDAEAIRDSLLAVAGRLDVSPGGASFAELVVPRRTLYLQSVRTGPGGTEFGRLFDRADPGSIVARRGESVVAPQALFFMNDPFVSEVAGALAERVRRETSSPEPEARIRRLYALALGRSPSRSEIELGLPLVADETGEGAWERYCQLILCQNEFLYTD